MGYSYTGTCPNCGNLCAAVIDYNDDNPKHWGRTAKSVADMIREGLVVERVDDEVVRVRFGRCTCKEQEE